LVVFRGLAAGGHSSGCSQDSGSNYSTGSWHHDVADLVPAAAQYCTPPWTRSRNPVHLIGVGETDGKLLRSPMVSSPDHGRPGREALATLGQADQVKAGGQPAGVPDSHRVPSRAHALYPTRRQLPATHVENFQGGGR